MSHRLARGLSDAFSGSSRRDSLFYDRPARYSSRSSRDYSSKDRGYGEYGYARPSDEYMSQEEEIRLSMRGDSTPRSRGRSRSIYDHEEPPRYRRVGAFGSPGHSSSKTPDISDSSRASRRQKSHIIEDSRPPRTSRIIPSYGPDIVYAEPPRRANSSSSRRSNSKSSPSKSRLSRIFGGSSSRTVSPEKSPRHERRSKSERPSRSVSCVVCMEDISLSRGADLKCGHRMCHSCLRRIFRMSTTDPQHMPPRCCGPEHIPLKYVDKLFDGSFKKTWNRKFEEYTSRNRLYCPSRNCGEWINPDKIRREDGRKVGRCGRCKTKVCGKCGKKWHASPKCDTDEETRQFLSHAADEGWKRCYRCKAMVERKEGCNHMTCRCGAEFCIICGVKWKGCDCPWFSHDATGADHLEHMNIPGREGVPGRYANYPQTYGEEMRARRLQELRDGVMARNMQNADYDNDYNMNGGIGAVNGIGNARGHFMNENYRRDNHRGEAYMTPADRSGALPERRFSERVPERRSSKRRPLSPPAPPLRPHGVSADSFSRRSLDADRYGPGFSRARSERAVPSRTSRRYEDEAAVHSPRHRRRMSEELPAKSSSLAGLNGKGRGMGRVAEWRSFVEPGVPEGESVVGHAR